MTFRVILRKDVIYKNNTSPLCLLFFHDNRKKSVGLGVSVVRSCWDAQAQKVTDDCPDRDDIQFQITAKIKEYEKKIKKLEALEIPVTFEALFETIGKRMDCTVGDYFRQIIDRLEKVEKYGSASKHKVTLALMSQFRSVNMRFDELDLTCLREFEIFLSQKGNVNNSCNYAAFQYWQLYLIEILHQTTTRDNNKNNRRKLYLIKILHQTTTRFALNIFSFPLYLIEILHQTTTLWIWHAAWPRCILLKFYIKPQLRLERELAYCVVSYWNSTSNHNSPSREVDTVSCILLKFYIKPQLVASARTACVGCILLKFYIKPQLRRWRQCHYVVVSYWNSTSNHNSYPLYSYWVQVVSYWNSTSNHNFALNVSSPTVLYLIEILHQTTTLSPDGTISPCCILSKFYIKPQRVTPDYLNYRVVSYRNSTSNHNQLLLALRELPVVSYRNSTSNHNFSVRHKNKI